MANDGRIFHANNLLSFASLAYDSNEVDKRISGDVQVASSIVADKLLSYVAKYSEMAGKPVHDADTWNASLNQALGDTRLDSVFYPSSYKEALSGSYYISQGSNVSDILGGIFSKISTGAVDDLYNNMRTVLSGDLEVLSEELQSALQAWQNNWGNVLRFAATGMAPIWKTSLSEDHGFVDFQFITAITFFGFNSGFSWEDVFKYSFSQQDDVLHYDTVLLNLPTMQTVNGQLDLVSSILMAGFENAINAQFNGTVNSAPIFDPG